MELMDQYIDITDEEFNERLRVRLLECTKSTLVSYLLDHAYEEMSRNFNNEILNEWDEEQDERRDSTM